MSRSSRISSRSLLPIRARLPGGPSWWLPFTLLVALVLPCTTGAAPNRIRVSHLSQDEGLSVNLVNDILQDRSGLLWVATEDGLNRWDGRVMTTFRWEPGVDTSLSNNQVWALHEDPGGTLWIATSGGLNRFDAMTETFEHFRHEPGSERSLPSDSVRAITQGGHGQLWIGTSSGVARFDMVSGEFTSLAELTDNPDLEKHKVRSLVRTSSALLFIGTAESSLHRFDETSQSIVTYEPKADDSTSLSSRQIRSLTLDRAGNLWVGTYDGGLNYKAAGANEFRRYRHDPEDPSSLGSDNIPDVLEDEDGTIWVAAFGGGLSQMTPDRERFVTHRADPLDPDGLRENQIHTLFQDRGGVLWIGYLARGLSFFNLRIDSFPLITQDPAAETTLSNPNVYAVGQARNGDLWIGTYGGGLNRYDRKTEVFRTLRHDPEDPRSLSSDHVGSLLVDSRGTLWVGTFRGGLNRYHPETNDFDRYEHREDDPNSLGAVGVMTMFEDSRGVLWLGLYGGGLNRFEPETKTFVRYLPSDDDPTSISSDKVTSIFEDDQGVFWVGTDDGGLNRFEPAKGTFTAFRHDDSDPASLASDRVWSIAEDNEGTLFFGTNDSGLSAWPAAMRSAGKAEFQHLTRRDGLAGNAIFSLVLDNDGLLWMGTQNGLSRLDPRSREFENFTTEHGLQSMEFNHGAALKNDQGELFFGGVNGVNAFFPDRINQNQHVPEVIVTSFLKNNERAPVDRPLAELTEVRIDHRDHIVTFDFAAIDYTAPDKNQYAYKLDGLHDEWIDLGSFPRATFTSLPAGKYTLRVKAANNDGVWNEDGLAIAVRVVPPPWRSLWAYGLYLMTALIVLAVYVGRRDRKLREELELKAAYGRLLEKEVAARTTDLETSNKELERLNQRLSKSAITDALTGLFNRHYLLSHLQPELRTALEESQLAGSDLDRRDGGDDESFSYLLLMVDLDGFKPLNDTFGHAAGDVALVEVAEILRAQCRKDDTIIRWGGDEFMVLSRHVKRDTAHHLPERIRSALSSHTFHLGDGQTATMSCSVGFAFFPFFSKQPELLTVEETFAIADRALYVAKKSGSNAWVGLYATETTPDQGLIERLAEDLEELVSLGALVLKSSINQQKGLDFMRTDSLEVTG